MSRKEFSKSTRAARYKHANGHCEDCGLSIQGIPEYDHDKEDYFDGSNDFANCRCLCRKCHDFKSAKNRPAIDKTRRIIEKAAGLRKTKRGFQRPPVGFNTWTREWER
jgi:5-methylcytosine-specific restriction endonuclease McrA